MILRKMRCRILKNLFYFLVTIVGLAAFFLNADIIQFIRSKGSKNKMADSYRSTSKGTNHGSLAVREDKITFLGSSHPSMSQLDNRTTHKTLKIYIYNLSSEFNTDISHCIETDDSSTFFFHCIDYSNHGMGKLLYRHGQISVHNTNQFSLDIILHHQFAHSRYRTNDPLEADIFYVPAYMGSISFCNNYNNKNRTISRLFQHLNTFPYFAQEKPHVTSLAKIEREQNGIILAHPGWKKLTYMTIEKANKNFRDAFHMQSQRAIVVPYPSYIHFNNTPATNTYAEVLRTHDRSIFLLLAAGLRMSNPFRAKIIGQFVIKTKLSFKEYQSSNTNRDKVMLVTLECDGNHQYTTIEWMQNSVFCLQPHGDSPTRKSFYDSILSGCIPVVFQFPHENVEFPFQRVLNYSDFTVQIPVNDNGDLEGNIPVYDYLRKISLTEVKRLQMNLLKVFHLFQYPVINTEHKSDHNSDHNNDQKDALDMIVDEIRVMYNL